MRARKIYGAILQTCFVFSSYGQKGVANNLAFWKDTISAENFGARISAPADASGFSASAVTDFIKKTRLQFQMGMLYAGNDTALFVYNLFNGHGNGALHFMRPILISRSPSTNNYFMAAWYNRSSVLLPGQSGSSNRLFGSLESGMSLQGHLAGEQDAIRLSGEYRMGLSWHNLVAATTEFAAPKRWYLAHLIQMKIESRNTILSFAVPLGILGFKYKLPFFFGLSQLL